MADRVIKGLQVAACVLCVLAILPLIQMMFRTLPLDGVEPIALPGASESSETGDDSKDAASAKRKGGKKPLPPEIAKRTSKLESSGIMGKTPKPPPMALVGIAEPFAFLRTPNGQTVKIKENETLQGVKVLRVGANRVLVEHEGQTSELSIFSGIGSESLMPLTTN